MTNIFHFGIPQCMCCLFVAKLPLTCAKLNSIPLNRARGPLNEICLAIIFFRSVGCQSLIFGQAHKSLLVQYIPSMTYPHISYCIIRWP